MKTGLKIGVVSFVLAMLLLAQVAIAQTKQEQQVASAVEHFRLAMVSGNRADLEQIASDKLQYGHSGGKVETKQEFVETLASGRSDFVTCDFSEIKITMSKEVAIVTFKLDAKTNDNNKPGEVHMRLMTTWQKQKGQWVLLARQAVKVQ
ncbi:MAG TPA: nuclear transport factor 2 family protein [Phnomibacter sp.]|nr:nuclear transport factor 2 family protein [Phnomibacter sp.]